MSRDMYIFQASQLEADWYGFVFSKEIFLLQRCILLPNIQEESSKHEIASIILLLSRTASKMEAYFEVTDPSGKHWMILIQFHPVLQIDRNICMQYFSMTRRSHILFQQCSEIRVFIPPLRCRKDRTWQKSCCELFKSTLVILPPMYESQSLQS